jgi:hypothetical protein
LRFLSEHKAKECLVMESGANLDEVVRQLLHPDPTGFGRWVGICGIRFDVGGVMSKSFPRVVISILKSARKVPGQNSPTKRRHGLRLPVTYEHKHFSGVAARRIEKGRGLIAHCPIPS